MANIELLRKNLEEKGYKTSHFATGAEVAAYVNSAVDGCSVGFGGCMTARDIGLYELLEQHNTCIWHWKGGDHRDAMFADIYITSANGVAETGELINIDGTGNRIAAAVYGHKKVYYLISTNKVTADLPSAIDRARNVAGPLRAQSMGRKTPCAVKADRCYDCKSPDRICRGLSVLLQPTTGVDEVEVVLIDEKFGL